MRPRRRKIALIAITAAISLGLAFAIGEIGTRMLLADGDVTPEVLRNRSLQYEEVTFARHALKQEARTIVNVLGNKKGLVWHINEKGYRGPDFDIEKPGGLVRVIVYGGSSVFDIKTTAGEDWPHWTQTKLREAGFPQVEIINAGIPGHTALESVGRLLAEGYAFEPDYVIVYNAWNDIKYMTSDKTAFRTIKPSLSAFDPRIHYHNGLDRWLCEVSQLYTTLRRTYYNVRRKIARRAADTRLPISAVNASGFEQYKLALEVFVDLARNIGAEPILMTQARLPHASNTANERERIRYHNVGLSHSALLETFDRLDSIVRDVADSKQTRLFDASAYLSGKAWAFHDHVHFVPKGSEALARFTASCLRQALEAQGAPSAESGSEDLSAFCRGGTADPAGYSSRVARE